MKNNRKLALTGITVSTAILASALLFTPDGLKPNHGAITSAIVTCPIVSACPPVSGIVVGQPKRIKTSQPVTNVAFTSPTLVSPAVVVKPKASIPVVTPPASPSASPVSGFLGISRAVTSPVPVSSSTAQGVSVPTWVHQSYTPSHTPTVVPSTPVSVPQPVPTPKTVKPSPTPTSTDDSTTSSPDPSPTGSPVIPSVSESPTGSSSASSDPVPSASESTPAVRPSNTHSASHSPTPQKSKNTSQADS